MDYFDKLMFEYYKVLNNAWKKEIREAALFSIKALSDIPKHERINKKHIDDILEVIKVNLGDDFASEVASDTKSYLKRCVMLGIQDSEGMSKTNKIKVPSSVSIGLFGLKEQKLVNTLAEQNLFWIGKHFDEDISNKFKTTLTQAIQSGFTRDMLADKLKEQFQDLGNKSEVYWQGLAEHTALKVREFARLEGYQKAGAKFYKLVVILDDRTSDICRALAKEDKLYPLDVAIEVRDNLLELDSKSQSLESARDYIKALAPWVSESQIIRDSNGNPTGISGAHTPFPPFHWKCRTATEISN
jgi:hypothetical protein